MKLISTLLFTCFATLVTTFAQDLEFQWAVSIGGRSDIYPLHSVFDSEGNIYTVGGYAGEYDFDPGAGKVLLNSIWEETYVDVFISKLDASGKFVWAKKLGSKSFDYANSVAVDAVGNVYLTGYFSKEADFDPGAKVYTLTPQEGTDIFIMKLNSNGDFVWAKQIGGIKNDQGSSIALDIAGNVYTTGFFRETADFDPGEGTFNITSTDSTDVFISKLDSDGNFVWAKRFGGTSFDRGNKISVDASGDICILGQFQGTADFDPGVGRSNLISNGNYDVFIAKYDNNGNFVWAKSIGTEKIENGLSMTIDKAGNIFTTGEFDGELDIDPGTSVYKLNIGGNGDNTTFILKLNKSGEFVWARDIGGKQSRKAQSIVVEESGNVYVTGSFSTEINFTQGADVFKLITKGKHDIFIAKLDGTGKFIWIKQMGGTEEDNGTAISLDKSGNVFAIGTFDGIADFDPEIERYNVTSSDAASDIYFVKLKQLTTGVDEATENHSFSIYPNPGNSIISVDFGTNTVNTKLRIVNVLGQTVTEVGGLTGDSFNIDISNHPKGIYIIELIDSGKISRRQYVKN